MVKKVSPPVQFKIALVVNNSAHPSWSSFVGPQNVSITRTMRPDFSTSEVKNNVWPTNGYPNGCSDDGESFKIRNKEVLKNIYLAFNVI
jgi:hypothetical protein